MFLASSLIMQFIARTRSWAPERIQHICVRFEHAAQGQIDYEVIAEGRPDEEARTDRVVVRG
jgi:hypothetical protein